MTAHRRVGIATLALGLAAVAIGQFVAPLAAPPLYDGVVVVEPYRWLVPPPGAKGGAKGATSTVAVKDGKNPLIAIATPEQPPQAQVFAPPGSLTLPPGATSLGLSIQPIPSEGAPTSGHIVGNVYRILIADQSGAAVTAPASAFVSVVLRGPGTLDDATTEQFVNGAWQPLKTSSAGFASTFLAVVTTFGDFALVAPGPGPSVVASGGAAPSGSASASSAASGAAASASHQPTGTVSVTPTASRPPATSPTGDSSGSPPILPIAILVAGGAGLAAVAAVVARRRRRRLDRYRGAHPQRRR